MQSPGDVSPVNVFSPNRSNHENSQLEDSHENRRRSKSSHVEIDLNYMEIEQHASMQPPAPPPPPPPPYPAKSANVEKEPKPHQFHNQIYWLPPHTNSFLPSNPLYKFYRQKLN